MPVRIARESESISGGARRVRRAPEAQSFRRREAASAAIRSVPFVTSPQRETEPCETAIVRVVVHRHERLRLQLLAAQGVDVDRGITFVGREIGASASSPIPDSHSANPSRSSQTPGVGGASSAVRSRHQRNPTA